MVKALDLRSNGRIVRVGSNPTPGNNFLFFFRQRFFSLFSLIPFFVIKRILNIVVENLSFSLSDCYKIRSAPNRTEA